MAIENVWESYSVIWGHIVFLLHYMLTRVLQVNVFLACTDETRTHTNFTRQVLHAVG